MARQISSGAAETALGFTRVLQHLPHTAALLEDGSISYRVAKAVSDECTPASGKDADFDEPDPALAEADFARFDEECRLADAAVAAMAFDDTFMLAGETYSLRLVYVHMISEYARHNGHADLLRERLDGTTGS